jgi:hypothetical protein
VDRGGGGDNIDVTTGDDEDPIDSLRIGAGDVNDDDKLPLCGFERLTDEELMPDEPAGGADCLGLKCCAGVLSKSALKGRPCEPATKPYESMGTGVCGDMSAIVEGEDVMDGVVQAPPIWPNADDDECTAGVDDREVPIDEDRDRVP